jgi:Raf kinase inhibitor-like YbhB/YbcL family protein
MVRGPEHRRRPGIGSLGWATWAAALVVATVTACATGPDVAVPTEVGATTLEVASPEFTDGGELPAQFTCDGAGDFPSVSWGELPAGTASVAVLVHDPDAPGGDYVHRLVSNLDPPAGLVDTAATPDGAVDFRGSDGTQGWAPPCPPAGDGPHRYVFTVYALNRPTRLPASAQTQTAVATVTEAAIGSGSVTALYARR